MWETICTQTENVTRCTERWIYVAKEMTLDDKIGLGILLGFFAVILAVFLGAIILDTWRIKHPA